MKKLITFVILLTAMTAAYAQPNHYITFNGTDQYMVILHHEDFNVAADQSFTMTGWVRNETYTNFPRYVCNKLVFAIACIYSASGKAPCVANALTSSP